MFQSNNDADAVIQSNPLIGVHYDLPLEEQRLILTLIARIQPDDEDFKPYRIPIKEFAEFMGIDKNSAYRECKQITKSLLSRVLKIAEPGRLVQTGWISSAQYIEGSGMITLRFAPHVKTILVEIQRNIRTTIQTASKTKADGHTGRSRLCQHRIWRSQMEALNSPL